MKVHSPAARPSYQVIARGNVDNPTMSGDGQVYAWTQRSRPGISEIERMKLGEEPELLTDDNEADKSPVLNRDGSVCAWERYSDDTGWDIVKKGPGDEDPVMVGQGDGPDWDAQISDNGNEIVWGAYSPNYRERRAMHWEAGQGVRSMTEPPIASALPQISGDGERIFYMRLAPAYTSNSIWMAQDNGEKEILYEKDPMSRNNRRSFAVSDDGTWISWVEKEGAAPAKLFRWNVQEGRPQEIREAAIIGSVDISNDGQTLAWTESTGGGSSQLMLHDEGETVQVTLDATGQNAMPTLSDDGNTLTWLWRNPKYLHPNEVRRAELG